MYRLSLGGAARSFQVGMPLSWEQMMKWYFLPCCDMLASQCAICCIIFTICSFHQWIQFGRNPNIWIQLSNTGRVDFNYVGFYYSKWLYIRTWAKCFVFVNINSGVLVLIVLFFTFYPYGSHVLAFNRGFTASVSGDRPKGCLLCDQANWFLLDDSCSCAWCITSAVGYLAPSVPFLCAPPDINNLLRQAQRGSPFPCKNSRHHFRPCWWGEIPKQCSLGLTV